MPLAGAGRAIAGHGIGIAAGSEKGGFIATCAEVAVDPSTAAFRSSAHSALSNAAPSSTPTISRTRSKAPWSWESAVRSSKPSSMRTGRITNARFSRIASRGFAIRLKDRCHPARPQGSAFSRGRRNTDRRHRTSHRQRHLRRHRHSPLLAAHGPPRASRCQAHPG